MSRYYSTGVLQSLSRSQAFRSVKVRYYKRVRIHTMSDQFAGQDDGSNKHTDSTSSSHQPHRVNLLPTSTHPLDQADTPTGSPDLTDTSTHPLDQSVSTSTCSEHSDLKDTFKLTQQHLQSPSVCTISDLGTNQSSTSTQAAEDSQSASEPPTAPTLLDGPDQQPNQSNAWWGVSSWKKVAIGAAVGTAVGVGTVAAAPVVLPAIGFSTTGVVAGSIAAVAQSTIGNVAAGSLFATLQSFGALGGLSWTAAGVTTAASVAAGTAAGATADVVAKKMNAPKVS